MRIIIDGYNVLKKMYHDAFIGDKEKTCFLNDLHAYAQKRGHEIVIVFDGGIFSYPERFFHKSIAVIYPGAQQTADDYIKEYITFKRGEQLLISSDRQLARALAEHDIASLDAFAFYALVQEALTPVKQPHRSTNAQKISHDNDEELDVLMEQASINIKHKKEDLGTFVQQPKKLSKAERKLFMMIKKL